MMGPAQIEAMRNQITADGGCVYPLDSTQDGVQFVTWGLTLRDYFAAQALPAIIEARRGLGEEAAAKSAYAHADAMLAARERK